MKLAVLSLSLSLLVSWSIPLRGQALKVEIDPPAPSSSDRIEIRISGGSACPHLSDPGVLGRLVVLSFSLGSCLAPPTPFTFTRFVGPLEGGPYALVVLEDFDGGVVATIPFEVSDAGAPPPGARLDSCVLGPQPAASLLVPYFEVDLGRPEGRTTLVALAHASSSETALARLVLWTDWGIPTLAADLLLAPGAIRPINLRDVFSGVQEEAPGLDFILPETLDPAAVAALRARHSGTADPAGGLCWSAPRDEALATGYVTIDLLERSSDSVAFPSDAGYFQGPERLASTDNRLTGDFFLVDGEETSAQGFEAVHLVAQPERFVQGDGPSFYGAFVGGTGADARLPLSTRHEARFFVGSPAAAGTELLVWLDNGRIDGPQPCGQGPPWADFGIPELEILGLDEAGNGFGGAVRKTVIRSQVLVVGQDVEVPVSSGTLDVETRVRDAIGAPPSVQPVQGWVAPVMSAFSRYSVGWNAVRLDDGCVTLRP